MVGMSRPWARQASRIVEPAGTETSTPSIWSETRCGIGTGGASGIFVARAGGVV